MPSNPLDTLRDCKLLNDDCRAAGYCKGHGKPANPSDTNNDRSTITINPAYLEMRVQFEKARNSVGHEFAARKMDAAMFEFDCEKKGIKPTWHRYTTWLNKRYKEVIEAKYEDEVKGMVALFEKEQVATGKVKPNE